MSHLRAKIVVQNRKTLLHFKAENEWTAKIDEARRFTGIVDANTFIRKNKVAGVDILMSFGDTRYDVRVRGSE